MYHLSPDNVDKCLNQLSKYMVTGSKILCDITNSSIEFPKNPKWRGFPFYFHSLEFMQKAGEKYNLKMKNIGCIKDWGYPKELVRLASNHLLEYTRNHA